MPISPIISEGSNQSSKKEESNNWSLVKRQENNAYDVVETSDNKLDPHANILIRDFEVANQARKQEPYLMRFPPPLPTTTEMTYY